MMRLGKRLATRAAAVFAACLLCASGIETMVVAQDDADGPYLVVLGIAQDGGYPQSGCMKACCAPAWNDPAKRRHVVSLGIVDLQHEGRGGRWLFEATPDFRNQLHLFDTLTPDAMHRSGGPNLDGIFLTHAHMGHYTGLMHLGHEAMGAKNVPVYAMPRMREFLSTSGPWDQLVRFENITLRELAADTPMRLNDRLTVTPFRVPHREEYSEVVGFRIDGPSKSILFIPDIDKWEKWDRKIEDLIRTVDVAYLDATFYADGEIPSRAMEDIPHPFVVESMARFEGLPADVRSRVRFIHFNHTNPALNPRSEAHEAIIEAGFRIAEQGERISL